MCWGKDRALENTGIDRLKSSFVTINTSRKWTIFQEGYNPLNNWGVKTYNIMFTKIRMSETIKTFENVQGNYQNIDSLVKWNRSDMADIKKEIVGGAGSTKSSGFKKFQDWIIQAGFHYLAKNWCDKDWTVINGLRPASSLRDFNNIDNFQRSRTTFIKEWQIIKLEEDMSKLMDILLEKNGRNILRLRIRSFGSVERDKMVSNRTDWESENGQMVNRLDDCWRRYR